MEKENSPKTSIRNYVSSFIDKRDNELRTASGEDDDTEEIPGIDRDSIDRTTYNE